MNRIAERPRLGRDDALEVGLASLIGAGPRRLARYLAGGRSSRGSSPTWSRGTTSLCHLKRRHIRFEHPAGTISFVAWYRARSEPWIVFGALGLACAGAALAVMVFVR
jgi:hypothetical protein